MFEFKIDDADELINKLSTLAPRVQRRGLDGAARAAMRPVQDAARTAAQKFDDPLTEVKIWKLIVTQKASRAARRIGGTMMRVGVLGGSKAYVENKVNQRLGRAGKTYETPGVAFYWRFREFGTEKQRADPFMQPAFERNLGKVQEIFADRLRKVLDREAAKSGAGAPKTLN